MECSSADIESSTIHASFPELRIAQDRRSLHHNLEALYRGQRRALESIAVRITRNVADAEDVVHGAFLRAIEGGSGVTSLDLLPWLKTVVRRLSIDRLRHGAIQKRYVERMQKAAAGEATLPVAATPEGAVLHASIQMLAPALQSTFRMWCEGWSYQDIAREHQIPLATVATRVLRAKARLQMSYGNESVISHNARSWNAA